MAQAGQLRPVAGDVEPPDAGQPDRGAQQQIDPLLRHQTAIGRTDDKRPAGVAARRRGEQVGIDAELGNNSMRPAIPLGPPHLNRLAVAHDAVVDPGQHLPLDEVERRGIAAAQVLPAEEERFGPGGASVAHGQPGGQVVRLFVDVDHVGPEVAQAVGQGGVVVVVEAAVEANGIDEQLIAGGVAALQDDTAVRVVPTGRHDDSQFDVREAGDGLQLRLIGPHEAGL